MPAAISLLLALAARQHDPLPPYGESLRCAGLAEARMRLVNQDSAEWDQLFDAALFWGLAASERARKDGLPASRFKSDQVAERDHALTELRSQSPGAEGELADCLKRVRPIG